MELKVELFNGGVRNSAVASQPCPLGHITADKREIKNFPKFATQTSFIRKTLAKIGGRVFIYQDYN